VIFDPNVERTISAKTHHMNCDYSLFEGWRIRGNPDIVLSRGKVIVENNQYKGRPGDGKFLKRGACATA
jgi:dihydropyrimidinase